MDLKTDEQWSSVGWRIAHNNMVDALVRAWTAERSVAEVVDAMRLADVPCAPVRTPRETIDWPHLRARGMIVPLRRTDGRETSVAAAGFPLKFSRSGASHDVPAPVPGAHTEEVLREWLGLDGQKVNTMRQRGVV